jgi:integrase
MAKQSDYLQEHGNKYRVRLRVPAKLQGILQTTVLIEPLGTGDRKLADTLKHAALARLKEKIRLAEKIAAVDDPLVAEALHHRLFLDDDAKSRPDEPRSQQHDDTMYGIVTRAERIAKTHGVQAAKSFAALASGQTTPVKHHMTTFANFKSYPMGSKDELERALGWIETWQRANHYPTTIESIDRRAASRFLSEHLMTGRTRKTASKSLSFIREYWKWMTETGHAADNPWSGQSLPNPPRPTGPIEEDNGKRPFTDTELAALIYGPADEMLSDVMRIAALSGMRIEEIFQLRVGDCKDGVFNILRGKTENSKRRVPIHSGLSEVISRRKEGKSKDAFLIEDLPDDPPKSRESRSDPAVKRFTRYRRKQKVDERPNGKRVSNVDFHSFRRWFIRSARNAMLRGNPGFDGWTFLPVVGHSEGDGRNKALDLSQQHYAGQDPETEKRNLVEAVKLPPAPKK